MIIGRALCAPGRAPALGPTEIRIANGHIASIAPADPAALTSANSRLLAMPAPTNAHDHGRGLRTIAFGANDDILEAWLPALAREPKSDPYLSAAVAFARMAEGGICATNHCHGPQDRTRLFEEADAVAQAAKDVGIRVAFAVPFMNRNRGAYGDIAKLLELLDTDDRNVFVSGLASPSEVAEMIALTERIADLENDFFKIQYGPIGPQWVSDAALKALAKASAETGRRIHMHLLETQRQREWADGAYPGGLVAFLDEIGLLSPRLTVAHGVWLRQHECELLAKRGVSVAVNLSSNLRLRSGLPPVQTFREVGLRCGIGLDALSLDDDEDMLREVRLAWRLTRGFGDTKGLRREDIFDAALVHGRKTVTDDSGGTLSIGAPADIIVLDLDQMAGDYVRPDCDISDLLLTRMAKRHIDRLIVGGRTVVERGCCVSVDLPGLEARLTAVATEARIANPPDDDRIGRMQDAARTYYRRGLHKQTGRAERVALDVEK